jgi:hypothetical protein
MRFLPPSSTLLMALAPAIASACPLCHSSTAEQVREGIQATAQNGTVLAAMFAPFLAVGIVSGFLHFKKEK